MILTITSVSILALGIYSAWLADPLGARSETIGQCLGGLLIVGGLTFAAYNWAASWDSAPFGLKGPPLGRLPHIAVVVIDQAGIDRERMMQRRPAIAPGHPRSPRAGILLR